MKRLPLLLLTALTLGACSSDSTSPTSLAASNADGIDLLQGMDVSSTAALDRSGIGSSELPDNLKLTADQKAQIAALHEAFQVAMKADLAAVKAIEEELRAARAAGKSREELAAILAKAQPYLTRLRAAFARLQADIWKVYTPAQQAWITSRIVATCRAAGEIKLTEAQVQQIRALREAFEASIKVQVELIRQVHLEAEAARKAGKSGEEIRLILAKAEPALKAIREAELRLKEALLGVLTEEQRKNPCFLPGLNR